MPGVDLWMMNTGFVGGDGRSVKQGVGLKVKIHHSSAMLEAMLSGQVVWVKDPDFGYEVVDVDAPENAALLALVPAEILQPRRLFAAQGRAGDHDAWVARMRRERREFLLRFGVDEAIITAGLCSLCRNDLFFSYRREGAAAGRYAAVIGSVRSGQVAG